MNQLPEIFAEKCQVIFDGVDTDYFKNDIKFISKTPKITYGTRGMEPMRCFPQFIREIPKIVKKIPSITIEIAGNDRCSYGGLRPIEGTWKNWAIKYLEKHNISKNINWVGFLQGDSYRDWLRSSWCHIYLTHPFVASWSLVESLHINNPMVVSDVKPVTEFTKDFENVFKIDHRKPGELASSVVRIIGEENYKNSANYHCLIILIQSS